MHIYHVVMAGITKQQGKKNIFFLFILVCVCLCKHVGIYLTWKEIPTLSG